MHGYNPAVLKRHLRPVINAEDGIPVLFSTELSHLQKAGKGNLIFILLTTGYFHWTKLSVSTPKLILLCSLF